MLLTIFLAIVFCAAISLMLLSAVAFIQKKEFFSSAPKEARELIQPREKELFHGARTIGWTLLAFSILLILDVGVIAIWDGFKSGFDFWQFFLRFVLIFTIYKLYVLSLTLQRHTVMRNICRTFVTWITLCSAPSACRCIGSIHALRTGIIAISS